MYSSLPGWLAGWLARWLAGSMARWMTLWRVFTSRSVWTTLPPTKQLNARQQGHKSYNFRSTCVQFFTVYRSLGPRFSRTLLQPLQLSFHSLASLLFLVSTHNNQEEGYLDEHMSFCYSLPQALHKPMCLSSCLHSKISISISFLNPQSGLQSSMQLAQAQAHFCHS